MAIACTHLDQIRGITSRDKHVCEERCLIRTEGPMLFLTERVSSLVPIFANSVILDGHGIKRSQRSRHRVL